MYVCMYMYIIYDIDVVYDMTEDLDASGSDICANPAHHLAP